MHKARVDNPLPAAPHYQQHKHGGSEHSAVRAGQRPGWYILRCGAGLDFRAELALRNAGWNTFCARELKWRPSTLRRQPVEAAYPRYPGYLFLLIETRWPDLAARPFAPLVHGVLAMSGRPVPLAPGEIDRLRAEDGQLAGATPVHRAFVPGQRVRVLAGAFRDYEAEIGAIDEDGAHITVQLLGRPASVPLPLTWLEAA